MRALLPTLMLAALLVGGTPVTGQDAQSRLWDAAIAGDTTAIRKAVTEGARLDSLDTRTAPNGRYALNWAALGNHVAAIKLMVALGARIEATNITGFTALNHAAETGAADAARALLAAGADPTRANLEGFKPADTARARGFTELAALLEAAAAKKKNE